MPRRLLHGWIALGFLLTSIHSTGCRLIGLGVGAMVDATGATRFRPGDPVRIYRISPGTHVVLVLTDSTRIDGLFRGTHHLADSVYAPRYTAWRDGLGSREQPPEWGEEVRFEQTGRRSGSGCFRGFGYRELLCESRGKRREIPFERLQRLMDAGGREYPLELLVNAARSRTAPVSWELEVQPRGGGRIPVDFERIARIEFAVSKNGAVVGFLVGATVDVAVVVALSNHDWNLLSGGGGCSGAGFR